MTFIRLPSETLMWKSYSWAPSQATGFLWIRVAKAVSWEGPCLKDLELPLLSWLPAVLTLGGGCSFHLQPEMWQMNQMLLEIPLWHWFIAGQEERAVSGVQGCFGSPGGRCQDLHPCTATSTCTFLFQLYLNLTIQIQNCVEKVLSSPVEKDLFKTTKDLFVLYGIVPQ